MANRLVSYFYATVLNSGVRHTGTNRFIDDQQRKLRTEEDIKQMEIECAADCMKRLGTATAVATILSWQEMDE